MSLAIVTTNQKLTANIISILQQYFPTPSTHAQSQNSSNNNKQYPNSLHVDTKYYSCTVPILSYNFYDDFTQQQQQSCALIFGFEHNQNIQTVSIGQQIEKWCSKTNADSVNILVDKNGEGTGEWKYQEAVNSCQGCFMPVVSVNLASIIKQRPERTSQGGLLDDQQELPEIFAVLELIETTSWPNMTKKVQAKAKKQQKMNQVQPKQTEIKHSTQDQSQTNPQPKQLNTQSTQKITIQQNNLEDSKAEQQQKMTSQLQEGQQQQQQIDEQQMERQMMEFEILMQQMMEVKSMPVSTNERKKKAEDLIMRLAGAMHQ